MKYTGWGKTKGDVETVETWENCFSHSVVKTNVNEFQILQTSLVSTQRLLCGVSKKIPDETTVKYGLKELQDSIDVNQLVEWKAYQRQQTESSK